jgi:hypothetical protein
MKAFPRHISDGWNESEMGMELRDYFAAHAPDIPSWFKRIETTKKEVLKSVKDGQNWYQPHTYTDLEPMEEYFFRWRYTYADMMMKAREK